MPDKFKIATAILAAALAYDMKVHRHNRATYKRVLEQNKKLGEMLYESDLRAVHLLAKLYDNDIALDDFDLIALNNPM